MSSRSFVRAGVGTATGLLWLVAIAAAPAEAHGVGGRTDLPLPVWLFAYGAGGVVIASFVALRSLWPRPRLRAAATGRPVAVALWQAVRAPVQVTCRILGLAGFLLVLVAAWWGSDNPSANLAPVAVYVVFWVGMQVLSAALGDVWRLFDPFDTLAAVGQFLRRRAVRIADGAGHAGEHRPDLGQWTAAVMLLAFVWLELAYFEPASPRAVAVWLTIHSVAALVGAAWWGRSWLRHGEGFSALFGLLAHLSPIHVVDGRLNWRVPFSGLATLPVGPGTGAVILVVLGSTTFDGMTRTEFWATTVAGRTGWDRTILNTVGLLFMIGVMAVLYLAATQAMGRLVDRRPDELALTFLASLVPIVFAYTLAHYFSLLIFEGQGAYALLSDPLGRGWDLLGTIDHRIDYTAVSTDTIAYVQAGSIASGHVVGVVAAHDRSVEEFSGATAEVSQYPLLGVMVLYTVGGLGLLLGG